VTLVYHRSIEGAATHAFVVGCGRYPNLGSSGSADRKAPVAGAVAMTRLLIEKRDTLVAPLGSVELLLSDPGTDGAADIVQHLPGAIETKVDPADESRFRAGGERWLDRIRPGDVVVFYFSGHGIADRVGDAVGLLEDTGSSRFRPWAQSFSVTKLALALRTMSAESAWVFFDACQEVVAEFAERLWEVKNIELKEITLRDVTDATCEPLALAGSTTGQLAWAPDAYEPPFFTQVLLKGLSGCCVERTREHGWAVTGVTLAYDLAEIARTITDRAVVKPQSLIGQSERKVLLAVERPFTPVKVRSSPEMHLKLAAAVRLMHGSSIVRSDTDPDFAWVVDVELEERELTVQCDTKLGAPMLASETFRQQPPAHNITLKPVKEEI
jgi:Caspase domain